MLLPRPEIRTPTRRGSRIVGGRPAFLGVPATGTAADGAAPRTSFDAADFEYLLAGSLKRFSHAPSQTLRDDRDHADAAVERACHLFRRDPSTQLQKGEDRRQLPTICIYDGMAAIRQNPRN